MVFTSSPTFKTHSLNQQDLRFIKNFILRRWKQTESTLSLLFTHVLLWSTRYSEVFTQTNTVWSLQRQLYSRPWQFSPALQNNKRALKEMPMKEMPNASSCSALLATHTKAIKGKNSNGAISRDSRQDSSQWNSSNISKWSDS